MKNICLLLLLALAVPAGSIGIYSNFGGEDAYSQEAPYLLGGRNSPIGDVRYAFQFTPTASGELWRMEAPLRGSSALPSWVAFRVYADAQGFLGTDSPFLASTVVKGILQEQGIYSGWFDKHPEMQASHPYWLVVFTTISKPVEWYASSMENGAAYRGGAEGEWDPLPSGPLGGFRLLDNESSAGNTSEVSASFLLIAALLWASLRTIRKKVFLAY